MAKWIDPLTGKELEPYTEALARIETARKKKANELYLSDLKLTELPESIGNLTHLVTLYLHSNQFSTLPENIGNLTHLKKLILSNNRLTKLPTSIGNLSQLNVLNLSGNQLTELPESICNLLQLQDITLWGNKISALPKSIGKMKQLKGISLFNNLLTTLPESIGNLIQLQRLYIGNNQLNSLPDSLKNLIQLNELYLHGNPSLSIPEEVLGPTWEEVINKKVNPARPNDILDYYFRTRGGKRPLNEAKLIIVGRGTVGKTSLVNRLLFNMFEPNENKTEGIKISEWKLRLDKNEVVRLNIWDFGGQEIMHATHQFFLTQRSIYLLVINGRDGAEDADVEYWLRLITSFAPDSPIIVVLNKIKQHSFDLNRRAIKDKYPNVHEFVKTDCQDGTGIENLKNTIEKVTDQLEHLRDAFPASWFRIKENLAGMRFNSKNFMNFTEYCDLCSVNGENEATSQALLATHLHNLGIALNYKDDIRLQDTHVLNPHWVTNGIYKILNSEKLFKQKGAIHLNDVGKILDSEEYPTNMRIFILDLMKKFELCFSFPTDDNLYLIPELLHKEEPVETSQFDPKECLNFQYHYPVLPEGLIPRFIVRTHTLSEGLQRWRTGVILKFEGCLALIKADVQDKKIYISISGKGDARRRLLAIIRSDFERIHHDIKNLHPDEMVPIPGYPQTVIPYQKLMILEKNGKTIFDEVVGKQAMELNVNELLNGIDLEGTRKMGGHEKFRQKPVRLFYIYSHKDKALRDELETHLKLLQRIGTIESWHDRKIDIGDDWKRNVDENLAQADIILLLLSPDFIVSDYCFDYEMNQALERYQNGEVYIIPIIIRDVNWKNTPFSVLQALPRDGKAVTLWSNRDTAWKNISEGIEQSVKEILSDQKKIPTKLNLENNKFLPTTNLDQNNKRKDTLRLTKIEIQNIRCFSNIEIDLQHNNTPYDFTMIFGENGMGKTSLLRCIGLNLCPEAKALSLYGRLKGEWINNEKEYGSIELELEDQNDRHYITKTIFKRQLDNTISVVREGDKNIPWESIFVCGYGAGRQFHTSKNPSGVYELDEAMLSVFDYDAKLQNSELAIRRITEDKLLRTKLLNKIDSILNLDLGSTELSSEGIRIRGHWGNFVNGQAIGDGYQATLSWLVDFLSWQALYDKYCPLEYISGIVLIDELEQHLHPSWQRLTINSLRDQFPNIQFITTSHSPICAGGLADINKDESALYILLRTNNKISARQFPILEGMRIDQILTSFFGFTTSRNIKTEQLLIKYAKDLNEKGPADENVIDLRKRVSKILEIHGEGKIDQTTYELLDELLRYKFRSLDEESRKLVLANASLMIAGGDH